MKNLPTMIEKATSPGLKQGLASHRRQTEGHVVRALPRRVDLGTLAPFERSCGESESIFGSKWADCRGARAGKNEEAMMEQIFGVVGSGSLFLSYCAYCEARDALRSPAFHISPGRAKLAGLAAAAVTLATGCLICLLLARAGAFYDSSIAL